jgi:hypothetical protein
MNAARWQVYGSGAFYGIMRLSQNNYSRML